MATLTIRTLPFSFGEDQIWFNLIVVLIEITHRLCSHTQELPVLNRI